MAAFRIRLFGDPVLRRRAADVERPDEALAQVVDQMVAVMREAGGVGLAAPQVGIERRLFVYDVGDGAAAVVNPELSCLSGEEVAEEGCLSIPGMRFLIPRAARVRLHGLDLDGKEIVVDATGLAARVFQHEVDHLDGLLVLDRLEPEQRRSAMRTLRGRLLEQAEGRASGAQADALAVGPPGR